MEGRGCQILVLIVLIVLGLLVGWLYNIFHFIFVHSDTLEHWQAKYLITKTNMSILIELRYPAFVKLTHNKMGQISQRWKCSTKLSNRRRFEAHDFFVKKLFQLFSADIVLVYCIKMGR
jgi:hypothetical protein